MTEYRQIIRGTEIELDGFLGLEGMRAYSTDGHNMRMYDGILLGGYTVLNENQIAALYTLPERLTVDGSLILVNANNAIECGFYRVVGTEANLPVPNQGTVWVGASADTADGDVVQIYCRSTGTYMSERVRSNGVWSAWVRVIDQIFGDTRYLGIGAQAVDSALLNGQNAAFYTNIVARLGYTPVNKAGDTMLGQLTSVGNPVNALHMANKQYVDAGDAVIAGTVTTLAGNAVRFDTAQVHTAAQKLVARTNTDTPWIGTIAGMNGNMAAGSFSVGIVGGECMSYYPVAPQIRFFAGLFSKLLNAPWVAGTGNGGIDQNINLPLGPTDTYHLYCIGQSAAPFGVDYCASLSSAGPATGGGTNIPATWDRYRRLASFRMGSGGAVGWSQKGNETLLLNTAADVSMTGTLNAAAASLVTLTSIPTGIQMGALTHLQGYKNGVQVSILITATDQIDVAVGASALTWFTTTAAGYVSGATGGPWRTNTAAQIRARSDTIASNLFGVTRGWLDDRGQYGGA